MTEARGRSRIFARWMISLALVGAVSGCGGLRERIFGSESFEAAALPFRATLARGEDRRDFTVTVRSGEAGLEEVRESARFRATQYCIERYGGSVVDWVVDPATQDWFYVRTADTLSVSGRCAVR